MIKANILNLSLSTTAVLGTTGGAIYYSKKSNTNNQPVTNMAGVGNEYKSSGDSNMVTDLTNLLNIDLTSVADLTQNISKLGGLGKIASLPSDLSGLTDSGEEGEELEDEAGNNETDAEEEDEDEGGGDNEADDEEEEEEEEEGDKGNEAVEDKTLEKTPKSDVDTEKGEDEVIELTDKETKVEEGTTEITDTEKTTPVEEEQVGEKDALPIQKEEASEEDDANNNVAEPVEKVPALDDPADEHVLPRDRVRDEGELEPIPPLTQEQKDIQDASGLEAMMEDPEKEATQQAEREKLAKIQEENPSAGIEIKDPGENGSTIDLSVDATLPALVEDTSEPINTDLTDVGGKDEVVKDPAIDGGDSTENINNEKAVLPVSTSTETAELPGPTPGEGGEIAETKLPNGSTNSDTTPVNEQIKDEPADIVADPIPTDNSSAGSQNLETDAPVLPAKTGIESGETGTSTETTPIVPPAETAVTSPEKPGINVVQDIKGAITQGPNTDETSKGQGSESPGPTREGSKAKGEVIKKDSSKGVSGAGEDDSEDELEEEAIQEEDTEEIQTQDEDIGGDDASEADANDEEIPEAATETNSNANIITLLTSLDSSIGNN